eukprot:COSAG01_NODE_59147_length_302_cov_0.433498_1_plen_46_part_10
MKKSSSSRDSTQLPGKWAHLLRMMGVTALLIDHTTYHGGPSYGTSC